MKNFPSKLNSSSLQILLFASFIFVGVFLSLPQASAAVLGGQLDDSQVWSGLDGGFYQYIGGGYTGIPTQVEISYCGNPSASVWAFIQRSSVHTFTSDVSMFLDGTATPVHISDCAVASTTILSLNNTSSRAFVSTDFYQLNWSESVSSYKTFRRCNDGANGNTCSGYTNFSSFIGSPDGNSYGAGYYPNTSAVAFRIADAGGFGPASASISFAYPRAIDNSTPLFDYFVIKAENLTSTDAYALSFEWYLPFTQKQFDTFVYGTGDELMKGIKIPFTGFPNVPNADIINLPMTASAGLYDKTLDPNATHVVATTSVAFNVDAQNNTSTAIFYAVNASGTGSGLTIATTSVSSTNPFSDNGSITCSGANGTLFQDPRGTLDYFWCTAANAFLYPHTFSKQLVESGFNAVKNDPPFVYAFGIYDAIALEGTSLQTATSSDLSLTMQPTGVAGIVPTSSITIISNTAFADLSGNSSLDSSIHDQLFTAEDAIMTLMLFGFMYIKVVGGRKGYH